MDIEIAGEVQQTDENDENIKQKLYSSNDFYEDSPTHGRKSLGPLDPATLEAELDREQVFDDAGFFTVSNL